MFPTAAPADISHNLESGCIHKNNACSGDYHAGCKSYRNNSHDAAHTASISAS